MARKRSATPARWTENHVKTLGRLAGKKSLEQISKILKRSEAAIRFKAHTEGISLARK